MAPLFVLIVVTGTLRAVGAAGMHRLRSWPTALRGGLAAMFVVTGGSHFVGMREDLISMIPPALPEPGLLVTITGVLELAGAIGLLWRRTVPWAAGGLTALLVAMFPANVYAALEGLTLAGAPAMPLLPRTLLQVVFLAATLTVLAAHLRAAAGFTPRARSSPAHGEHGSGHLLTRPWVHRLTPPQPYRSPRPSSVSALDRTHLTPPTPHREGSTMSLD